jgi:hypothetical protein
MKASVDEAMERRRRATLGRRGDHMVDFSVY